MKNGLLGILALAVAATVPLEAQMDSSLTAAAATITPEEIARHIGVLAHDSMQGRDTPSRGLALTAGYLADQFTGLGLVPGGEQPRRNAPAAENPWFIHYCVPGTALDYAATTLAFRTRAKLPPVQGQITVKDIIRPNVVVDFGTAARFVGDTVPASSAFGTGWELFASQASVVLAGPHTAASVQRAALQDRIVFYVPSPSADSTNQRQVIDLLRISNRVIVLADEDSMTFAARRDAALRTPVFVLDQFMAEVFGIHGWAAYVWPPAIAAFLHDAGLDLAQARAATTPVIQELPVTSALLVTKTTGRGIRSDTATAVNVVGVLEGADSALKQSYIIVTAHMDAGGIRPGQPNHVDLGADDNASGVAGLLALAKAFSQPGARPSHSIVFVGLSGSAKGFVGARYGMGDWQRSRSSMSKDLELAINLDMIGRDAGDSLRVDGSSDLDLSVQPAWVAALHPELRLTLVDGGSAMNVKSDHMVFVRCQALPTLYFYNGSHADVPRDDTPATIDADQEARILRLVFYVTHDLAQAEARPRWTAEGHQRLLQFLSSCS